VGASLGQLGEAVNAAAAGGGFTRADAQLLREEFPLDEKGFQDAAKELARTRDKLAKIRDDAARRIDKVGDDAQRANVVLMLFEATSANGTP
jgi:hypothetical protein